MYDPNDDTDVTSGSRDGALMETTSPPRPQLQHAPSVWVPERGAAHFGLIAPVFYDEAQAASQILGT